jgi:flagellar biosynthesis/type III secretory pathway M-ring protein FliF/YscJ
MRIKVYLGFLMLAVMAIVMIGIAVFLTLMGSGISRDLSMKELEIQGIEEMLKVDPGYSAGNGFVVNPYQNSNSDRSQALLIGTSISYILKEIKAFVMFSVVLAVLALIAYVIIAYIILNKVTNPKNKPSGKKAAPQKDDSDREDEGDYNDSKRLDDYIEGRNSKAVILSRSIDEMLSDIDSIMEKSKVKWSVSL